MYLKRLELQGFKSFADKTVLDFGQGVTTVVGPNGSGKSNISDAIRWVMGEMSAKQLRGANMQDVIFSGTETRKQVNYAQVNLVLDNSDKMFGLDFDEIIVTRKVFRSGESVYQINNSDCRLKDIHELFMDTGLGRDGYSMIGQGNVAQILSTKAEDRRAFFQEAAGVSKYKHRKDEALRKLASVNENLVRINDITEELSRQLGPLENQSKKARKYLVLYEEYKGLDVSMCIVNLAKNAELSKKSAEIVESVTQEIEALRSKETEIESIRNELYQKSSQKDEEHSQKNAELIDNEAKSMHCMNEMSINENNIANNNSLIERIENEISLIEKKSEEALNQIEELKISIKKDDEEKQSLLNEFEEIQKNNSEIFEKLSACKAEIDAYQAEVVEKMNEVSKTKAQVEGVEALRANYLERREAVEAEIRNYGAGIENTKSEIQENENIIQQKTQKAESMKQRADGLLEKISSYKKEEEKNKELISDITVSLNSKTSQKKILEGMENDYEGFSKSVKAVMTAPELKKTMIYGTVSGLIEVDKKYVVAVETALGGAMQNIVVETEDDAKEAIEYLKVNRAGRATFLPVSSVDYKPLEKKDDISKFNGYLGLCSEMIRYDKKYDGIMKNLLGRVVLTDNMNNAVKMAREFGYRFKIVTLEGELLNPGGSISGGSVNKTSGFLSRAAKIKELGDEILKLNKELTELTQKNNKLIEDISNSEKQLSDYQPLLREYENDIIVAKNNLEHLRGILSSSDSSEKSLNEELSNINEYLSKSADEVAMIINTSRNLERSIEATNLLISEKEDELNRITEEKDNRAQQLIDETLRLKSIENESRNKQKSIEDLQLAVEENNNSIKSKSEDKNNLFVKNEELRKLIEEKNLEIERIKQISESIKNDIEEIEREKQSVVEGLKGITNDNKDVTDRLMNLQQELSRAEAKQQKHEADNESIINRLWDEYELTPSGAEEISQVIENETEARQRVQELKGKIKALGSVNLDAIDEYVETKERFDFLSEQKTDLENSEENLNKVIASMQELMEENFQKQFEEINKSFSRVFSELFGGGRGRLYLSDPDEVMDSGIEIEVQLPGKGLQNINLYSGGEKSFIAIALLFAILEVKPTPFCFLDEIDAALDDVNVARFATYLKNYMNQTQFIVITHRRGTMESANIMYGVTMQEKGVSKLLSLQIDDVDESVIGAQIK